MNVISAIEKNVCGNKKSTISHIRNFIVADIGHKGMKKGGWPMRYKDIEGYEGMYGVTEHGDVFAYTRMRISKNNVPQIVWEHPIKKPLAYFQRHIINSSGMGGGGTRPVHGKWNNGSGLYERATQLYRLRIKLGVL